MYDLVTKNYQPVIRVRKMAVMMMVSFLLLGCNSLERSKKGKESSFSTPGMLGDLQTNLLQTNDQARQGQAEGQVGLGKIYWGARYYQDALAWFHKAALQGNAEAKYRIGYAYYTGLGVERNLDSARQWYQQASEAGSTQARDAQALLESSQDASGVVYPSETVLADPAQARAEWEHAALAAEEEQKQIAPPVVRKPVVARKSAPAKRKAHTAKKVSQPVAQSARAEKPAAVTQPEVVTTPPVPAVDIAALKQQAEQGDVQAQLALSILYFEGKEVDKDLPQAVKWGTMAAEAGNSIAQNN
ncbi:MAG: hypothetical protein ACRC5A_11440, partial [Enterobacteriaceae bacterium]